MQKKPRRTRKQRPRWMRMLRMIVAIPLIALCVLCAVSAYRIYAGNEHADTIVLPAVQRHPHGQSILIFSPHPDDEALGTAGLMQTAKRDGVPVHVVFMTCGDGFRIGVQQYYHLLKAQPSDCIKYGEMRHDETLASLANVGVQPSQVEYLGYPDAGLTPIWRDHWQPSGPYQSGATKASSVPYPFALSPGAPYCGQSILADVLSVIRKLRPTDIYVTHPNDDHPYHAASSAYVTLATQIIKAGKEPWEKALKLHYYLVHRGDWPVPQGLHEDYPLAPPAGLFGRGTNWSTLPLTDDMEHAKARAIDAYKSQDEMMGRFLTSFVRKNEIFGDIPSIESSIPVRLFDGTPKTSTAAFANDEQTTPFELDPVGDNIILSMQPGVDIAQTKATHDAKNLYVQVGMNGDLLPEVRYQVHIRCFDMTGSTTEHEVLLTLSPRRLSAGQPVNEQGGAILWQGDRVDATVPLTMLHAAPESILFIDADTSFGNLRGDRTGPHTERLATGEQIAPFQ